ncbi:MAG: hypothetical protein QOJ60_1901 [Actinomycetota bacterium]|nr:hypothetical protein [Actinomycetota bacterium]
MLESQEVEGTMRRLPTLLWLVGVGLTVGALLALS